MCLVMAVAGEDVREGMWREEDVCCSVGFSWEGATVAPWLGLLALPR